MTSLAALVALLLAASPARPGEPGRPGSGWYDVRDFGAVGDGRTDDSRAIQAALDAARRAGGGVVHVPAGTYLVAPPPPEPGRPGGGSLTIGSRTWLRGDGAASVIKVREGAGSYRALLANHPPATEVEDVTISDLRFDQSCGPRGGRVGYLPDSKSELIVYLAWGGRNLTVERVRFDPVCGVNTVVLNAPTSRNLVVRDSYFRFVKNPTAAPSGEYDNTAVYLYGRELVASGNLFESTVKDRARGAIELHGARGLAANNVSRDYRSCVRVVGTAGPDDAPPPVENGFNVSGNVCTGANDAINVWAATRHHVRGVTIAGNTIGLAEVDHLALAKDSPHFSGISFVWDAVSGQLDGEVSDVVIEGNTITAQPAAGVVGPSAESSAGISLACSGSISNVVVRGNVLRDLPAKGIELEARRDGARASRVRIEGNVIVDAGHDPAAGPFRAAIRLGGLLEDVEVAHNTIASTRVPFRGLYAIRAEARRGSRRVGIHDNVWSVAQPGAAYQLALDGPVDAGPGGRTRSDAAPERGSELTLDAAGVSLWEISVTGPGPLAIRGPTNATPGQRLTIRLRNDHPGRPGDVVWKGFKMAPWTGPPPGQQRALEVLWDGRWWREVSRSADVPN